MSMENNKSFIDELIESVVKKAPLYAKATKKSSSNSTKISAK